jgi:putative flavoprotein involved in K+ transport
MDAVVETKQPVEDAAECVEVVVVGGGQAGLAVGYHLARRGLRFVILDANARIGDAWRKRWDSLRLFTPARYDGLPGMPFPAPPHSFPTKDQVADYLEAYAARFELPVRTGVRVDGLSRNGDRFVLTSVDRRFEANNVVVAMSTHQVPWVPPFAPELDPGIVQLHAGEYRNPSQLQDGGVLVVGTGNSGAEIALDVAAGHPTWLSGRDPHVVPFRIETAAARHLFLPLVLRVVGHHVLTVDTPIGRKMRPKVLSHGAPLIRVKPKDIAAAGIERVPRTVGVRAGLPRLEDQRALEVANVVWCTGFRPDFSWIDLPVFADKNEPRHERGIVADEPGLYFVGLLFLYAMSSGFLPGVGRDAERVAKAVASRTRAARSAEERRPARPPAPSRLIEGDGKEDAMTTQELGQTTTRHTSPRTG